MPLSKRYPISASSKVMFGHRGLVWELFLPNSAFSFDTNTTLKSLWTEIDPPRWHVHKTCCSVIFIEGVNPDCIEIVAPNDSSCVPQPCEHSRTILSCCNGCIMMYPSIRGLSSVQLILNWKELWPCHCFCTPSSIARSPELWTGKRPESDRKRAPVRGSSQVRSGILRSELTRWMLIKAVVQGESPIGDQDWASIMSVRHHSSKFHWDVR